VVTRLRKESTLVCPVSVVIIDGYRQPAVEDFYTAPDSGKGVNRDFHFALFTVGRTAGAIRKELAGAQQTLTESGKKASASRGGHLPARWCSKCLNCRY
jgi:hypothetical protein